MDRWLVLENGGPSLRNRHRFLANGRRLRASVGWRPVSVGWRPGSVGCRPVPVVSRSFRLSAVVHCGPIAGSCLFLRSLQSVAVSQWPMAVGHWSCVGPAPCGPAGGRTLTAHPRIPVYRDQPLSQGHFRRAATAKRYLRGGGTVHDLRQWGHSPTAPPPPPPHTHTQDRWWGLSVIRRPLSSLRPRPPLHRRAFTGVASPGALARRGAPARATGTRPSGAVVRPGGRSCSHFLSGARMPGACPQ